MLVKFRNTNSLVFSKKSPQKIIHNYKMEDILIFISKTILSIKLFVRD